VGGLRRVLLEIAQEEEPAFLWRGQGTVGIADVSAVLASLALQGPRSHLLPESCLKWRNQFAERFDRQACERLKRCRLSHQALLSPLDHPAPLSLVDAGYHKSGFGLIETIQRLTEEERLNFFLLKGSDISSKNALFEQAEEALHFPKPTGKNWDAFADRLRDIPEIGTSLGDVILFDNFEILDMAEPYSLEIVLYTFAYTVDIARNEGRKIWFFMRGDSSFTRHLPFVEEI